MWPTSDQGIGIFFAALGIGFLLWLAGRADFHNLSLFGLSFMRSRRKTKEELAWDHEAQQAAAGANRRQLEDGFRRYAEAAVAMVAMVEASGRVDEALTGWFDLASSDIAAALTVFPEDFFRVAIWADLGHPDHFVLLGAANHDRNDVKMQTLAKANTIGGHAWRAKAGEYLCVDISKDRKFKARSALPRPYTSIFAIRVGDRPWGVMTIDAPRTECFGPTSLLLIRRFAKLISAGAAIASARYGPNPAAAAAGLPIATPRIVTIGPPTSGMEPGEDGADDQP